MKHPRFCRSGTGRKDTRSCCAPLPTLVSFLGPKGVGCVCRARLEWSREIAIHHCICPVLCGPSEAQSISHPLEKGIFLLFPGILGVSCVHLIDLFPLIAFRCLLCGFPALHCCLSALDTRGTSGPQSENTQENNRGERSTLGLADYAQTRSFPTFGQDEDGKWKRTHQTRKANS